MAGAAIARLRGRLLALSSAVLLAACQHGDIVMDAGETISAAGIYATSGPPVPPQPRVKSAEQNILVLTSGGADGAFGAGVLTAWSSSGRPVFDVVAGASTGALQATPAFLGPAWDGLLEQVYTTTRTRDVFRSNGLKTLVDGGYYNPAPLRRLLVEHITEAMLDEVARAHAQGRRLYVATTDMTAGTAVFWDMGAIAASADANRRNYYIDVLIASVAVPGLVEPVRVVNRQSGTTSVHSDGGVKAPVPLEGFMLDPKRARRSHVWVIANGHVSRDAALRSDAGSTLALARRGVSQLLRQLLYSSVREAEVKALRAGAQFRLIALPETSAEAADPFDFKPGEMRTLFERGRETGWQIFRPVQVAAR